MQENKATSPTSQQPANFEKTVHEENKLPEKEGFYWARYGEFEWEAARVFKYHDKWLCAITGSEAAFPLEDLTWGEEIVRSADKGSQS